MVRAVDMVYLATNGKVVVGTPIPSGAKLVTSRDTTPESFRDTAAPIAGPAGLEEAVREGLLRKATSADAEAWSNAVAQSSPNRDVPPIAGQCRTKPPTPPIYNAYVVPKPFTYPSGLYGGNSATFLIPKGVSKPTGNLRALSGIRLQFLELLRSAMRNSRTDFLSRRRFVISLSAATPTPSEKVNFSPANDQGLAPLRPCYSRHMRQIDDRKMSDREIARSAMKACPQETKKFLRQHSLGVQERRRKKQMRRLNLGLSAVQRCSHYCRSNQPPVARRGNSCPEGRERCTVNTTQLTVSPRCRSNCQPRRTAECAVHRTPSDRSCECSLPCAGVTWDQAVPSE